MSWILAGILFILLACSAYHASELESERNDALAERDAACDRVDDLEAEIRNATELQQFAAHHANLRGVALEHAFSGDLDSALALITEHAS